MGKELNKQQPLDNLMGIEKQTIGWISLKDAVPPYNKGVIITDEKGIVSFGRIDKIRMGYKSHSGEPTVSYEWRCVEPFVHNPTHWMPLPKQP